MPAQIAVVLPSSTGHVHQLAEALAHGAREAGAEVRLRRAPELAPPAAVEANPAWKAHLKATADVAAVTHDDFAWANGYAPGSPTRYGQAAAQLKRVLDGLAPLRRDGRLKDKAATAFTSTQNPHGGAESTLLSLSHAVFHWGSLIVPPDTLDETGVAAGGNPYGVSTHTGPDRDPRVPPAVLAAARRQGGASGLRRPAGRLTRRPEVHAQRSRRRRGVTF